MLARSKQQFTFQYVRKAGLTMPDATTSVLTRHNDNNRTGAYLQETQLNTSNVNQQQFGKLFAYHVDGQIYAQPLYVSNMNMADGDTHNVVYVATMHNTVYAFDADNPVAANSPLWSRSLGSSAPLPDPNIGPVGPQGQSFYRDISIEVGIISTPVISLDKKVIYVVAFTKVGNTYSHHLHALDLVTGEERMGGPVQIVGSAQGNGYDSKNGTITFTSNRQIQRAGLLLANNVVYIAFAAYGDAPPYHGWVFAYNATTLQRMALYNTTPNGREGGIWQAGQGLVADGDNNIYFITGNGTFTIDARNLGCAIVKLKPNLSLADWFAPHNCVALTNGDQDLGSAGALLIPGNNLLLGGGKESKFYLIQRDHMGHFNANNDDQIVQSFYVNLPGKDHYTHHIHSGPVYWNGPNGPWIYVWSENDYLKAYHFDGEKFQVTPVSTSTTRDPQNVPGGSIGMPGGFLSISANGNTPGTGIVWASHPYEQNANQAVVDGIVRAYDASDLTKELWNSKQNASRDDIGKFAKFCPPTVANGKVYVASFSGELTVYGLLSSLD
jgi:hypothetical protein